MDVQVANGVVDVAVADEAEAVAVAKQYLSYFQGPSPTGTCADQRLLRTLVPENRLRAYDVREVIDGLADTGSVLELRRGFGPGMITALVRIEGRPIGVIANNPMHLGGAIDSDGADKAARFMQLCDAFDIPILFLCDTPGNMVGPEPRRPRWCATAAACSWIGANVTCRSSPWCCARATAWARWAWPAAASRARVRPCRGRPASSAAWAWRARSSSAGATSWPRSRTRPSAAPSTSGASAVRCTSRARRCRPRRCSRSTT
jgi:hypothetical protein